MSVPPDDFDPNNVEDDDEQYVVWQGPGEPPEWFYDAAGLLAELDERDSVFLEVQGGLGEPFPDASGNFAGGVERHDDGTYTLMLHAFDEDTGEDLYYMLDNWDHQSLIDFQGYTEDYYANIAFWDDKYSLVNI